MYVCMYIYIYIYSGILLIHKKEWNNAIYATWMDLKIIILSGVRERQILYNITYKWNLKNNTNESIYKTGANS